jgi:hypothetical protein
MTRYLRTQLICSCATVVAKQPVVVSEFHGNQKVNTLCWYPAPGAGQLDPNVNRKVAACYDEAAHCLSIGANRAAAAMFRAALHCLVEDKGKEWTDHLNQNIHGAHAEDFDDVTQSEARAVGDLVRHLIRHDHEMPAQLRRGPRRITTAGVSGDVVDRLSAGEQMTERVSTTVPGLERGVFHELPGGVCEQRRPGAGVCSGGIQEVGRRARLLPLTQREQLVPALHTTSTPSFFSSCRLVSASPDRPQPPPARAARTTRPQARSRTQNSAERRPRDRLAPRRSICSCRCPVVASVRRGLAAGRQSRRRGCLSHGVH